MLTSPSPPDNGESINGKWCLYLAFKYHKLHVYSCIYIYFFNFNNARNVEYCRAILFNCHLVTTCTSYLTGNLKVFSFSTHMKCIGYNFSQAILKKFLKSTHK